MADRKDDAADENAATQHGDAPGTEAPPPSAEDAGPEAGTESGPADPGEPVSAAEAPEASGMTGDASVAAEPPAPSDDPPPSEPVAAHRDSGAARTEPEEYHEEEPGSSLASKVLTALVLLIAGAALGIWAGPKLAPMLPSGMSGVADWLTPGAAGSEEEIATLRSQLETEVSALSSRVEDLAASGPVTERIDAALGAVEERTSAEIAGLQAALADLGGTETSQRIARLQTAIEGQQAELATIKEQISGGVAAVGELSDDAAAQIDIYRAELEGLRGEVGSVSDAVAALRNRIDEVAATADRSIETAQTRVEEIEAETSSALGAAAINSNVAMIRAALASGQPYTDPASELAADGSVALPEGLAAAADSGAPTLVVLRARFPDAAYAAIRAAIVESSGDDFVSRSRAYLEAQLATRSLTPQEGSDPDAVLSRMEEQLRTGDLAAVLAEAEALPSEAAAAMQDWLTDARLRAQAEAGLAELESGLSAMN